MTSLIVNPTQFTNAMTISVVLQGVPSEPVELFALLGSVTTPKQVVAAEGTYNLVFTDSDIVPTLTAYGAMNLSITLVNGANTEDTITIPVNRESITTTKYVRTFNEYDGGFGMLRATKTNDKVEPLNTTIVLESTHIGNDIFEVPVVSSLLTMELVE